MTFKITDNPDHNRMEAMHFKRAVQIAGLDLPAFDPATVPTADWTPATVEEIAEAAFKVAATGGDPAADPNVQALLTSRLLANTIGGLYQRNQIALSRAELEHYQTHAPAVLEDLANRFQEAVDTMTEAIPVIGHVDLQYALLDIANMPDRKAAAVAAAHAANNRTARLIEALEWIVPAATGSPLRTSHRTALLAYTKPDHQQFKEHHLDGLSTRNNHGRAHNVWDLLNDGVTVELATTDAEVQDRIQALDASAQESRRNRQAEEAQRSEARAQAKAMGYR